MLTELLGKFNFYIYIALMVLGLYAMMAKRNLIKKLIGMNIFQWSIILYFISLSVKHGGSIPVLKEAHAATMPVMIHASQYVNPLPHVLMLTAIVVGVGTTGVALALVLTIYKRYGTLDEEEILKNL